MSRAPLLLTLVLACGDGGPKQTSVSASSTDASTGSTSSGSTGTEPTTAEPTTAEPTTSGPNTSTTTDAASTGTSTTTTSTTTGDSSSSSGTTGGDAAEYAAFWWSGGLNHLIVRKFDAEHARCTTLALAWPSQGPPGFDIAMPMDWAVQSATIHQDIGDCLMNWQPPPDVTAVATGGTGQVQFVEDPNLFCPKTLDLDVTLSFDANMPWIPAEDVLSAVAVPVQNCP